MSNDGNESIRYLGTLISLLRGHIPGKRAPKDSETGASDEREEDAQTKKRQVIVRSEKEAANGQVTAVQAALRNGWRLVDIRLRDGNGEAERRLAFVLRRANEEPSRSAV